MTANHDFEPTEGPLERLRRALARRVGAGEIDVAESQRQIAQAEADLAGEGDGPPGAEEQDPDVLRELGAGSDAAPMVSNDPESMLAQALSELATESSDRTIAGLREEISSVNGGSFMRGALFALALVVAIMVVMIVTVFASAQIVVDAIRSAR